ncbi:unnamed protein product [Phytophthora lilii]|uniref:Unnamed protein product n=1 Tax=Phytophthora lilii TaxID=2077276 RepID=A0A9W6Y1H5_9STRA|nr:unnamed protein product [Phytophthora lilii]
MSSDVHLQQHQMKIDPQIGEVSGGALSAERRESIEMIGPFDKHSAPGLFDWTSVRVLHPWDCPAACTDAAACLSWVYRNDWTI